MYRFNFYSKFRSKNFTYTVLYKQFYMKLYCQNIIIQNLANPVVSLVVQRRMLNKRKDSVSRFKFCSTEFCSCENISGQSKILNKNLDKLFGHIIGLLTSRALHHSQGSLNGFYIAHNHCLGDKYAKFGASYNEILQISLYSEDRTTPSDFNTLLPLLLIQH